MQTISRMIFPQLKEALNDQRVVLITGMRRVGKTTTLHWLLDQVDSNNKIFLDLERMDLRSVFQESNYEMVFHYLLSLGLKPDQPMTVALDEIQNTPNLPSVVKYLYDNHDIKFILTGSSSFYLKNFFSESLAGRKVLFEMFPLSFGEFLDFKGIPFRRHENLTGLLFDPHEYDRLKASYDEFIAFGGLPNVVLEPRNQTKREILNDILSSYVNIDVRSLADFRKIGELQQLLKVLAMRIGNKLDHAKLAQIVGITRPTLNEYLEFLEKTYIIHRLPAYAGPDRTAALGKKLFFRDNGIAYSLSNPGEGALFENAIFNQLWHYGQLNYLSKGSEYEIEFVLTPPDNRPVDLEVKYHPVASDGRKLNRIALANGLEHSRLVGRQPTPGFRDFLWGGSIL